MKYLIIKDPHFRFGKNKPIGRNHTFFDEVKNKMSFVGDYCVQNNINNIIFTGDLLDHKDHTKYTFTNYRAISEYLYNFKEQYNVDIYSICGNHDAIDNHYDVSVYADLDKRGVIKDISYNLNNFSLNGTDFSIFGVSHMYDFDDLKQWLKTIDAIKINHTKVCVVHQNVIPMVKEGAEEFFDTIDYHELSNMAPSVDVWVCGHYHKGYPIRTLKVRNKEVVFINPFSLTRLSRGDWVKTHIPQFVVADFSNNTYETIDIPHVLYEEAFNLEETKMINTLYENESNKNFINDIKQLRENNNGINNSTDSFPDEIKQMIEHYLNLADKEIK